MIFPAQPYSEWQVCFPSLLLTRRQEKATSILVHGPCEPRKNALSNFLQTCRCPLQRGLFRVCTLHSLAWRSIMHHAATQLLDLSLLPFQDLYARFCYKASQKSMGWEKKSEGTDATDLLLRSFQLLFSRLGDQPFPRHDLPGGN